MRCIKCGTNLPDQSMFCPECGTMQRRQQNPQSNRPPVNICRRCGARVPERALFCSECGNRMQPGADPVPGQRPGGYRIQPEENADKNSGKAQKVLLVVIAVLSVLLVGGLIALGIQVLAPSERGSEVTVSESKEEPEKETGKEKAEKEEAEKEEAEKEEKSEHEEKESADESPAEVIYEEAEGSTEEKPAAEVVSEDGNQIVNPSEEQIAAADFNLFRNRTAELGGVMATEDGKKGIRLEKGISVYGAGAGGKAVLLKNVEFIPFNTKNAKVTDTEIVSIKDNTSLNARGKLSIVNNMVCMFPDSLNGSGGNAENTAVNAPVQTAAAEPDYILPQSQTQYLTEADVRNLSCRELNYAKNEIYARRGRKFDSPELQRYFNSKSWYKGTIAPSNFSESVFNEIEKANIRFLRDKEYAMNPNGYPLDQN